MCSFVFGIWGFSQNLPKTNRFCFNGRARLQGLWNFHKNGDFPYSSNIKFFSSSLQYFFNSFPFMICPCSTPPFVMIHWDFILISTFHLKLVSYFVFFSGAVYILAQICQRRQQTFNIQRTTQKLDILQKKGWLIPLLIFRKSTENHLLVWFISPWIPRSSNVNADRQVKNVAFVFGVTNWNQLFGR